jgi:hypothetical protein
MVKVMALLLACCGMSGSAAAETVVLHDVNLIDGRGGPPRMHTDVLIQDGRRALGGGWETAPSR